MPINRKGRVVIFTIVRDGRFVDCVGRLDEEEGRIVAVNCAEVESKLPLPRKSVLIDRRFLRRGHDDAQGKDRYYYSGTVNLDQ